MTDFQGTGDGGNCDSCSASPFESLIQLVLPRRARRGEAAPAFAVRSHHLSRSRRFRSDGDNSLNSRKVSPPRQPRLRMRAPSGGILPTLAARFDLVLAMG
jgi:hypothetical protein